MSEKRMSELSLEAQTLLRTAKNADGPSDADRDRVRSSLMAAIAAGGAATAAGAAEATTAAATASSAAAGGAATGAVGATAATAQGLGLATKLTLAVALTVGGGTGIYVATQSGSSTEATPPAATIETAPSSGLDTPPPTLPAPISDPAPAIAPTVEASADEPTTAPTVNPTPSPRATRRPAVSSKRDSNVVLEEKQKSELEEERELLELASTALRNGNATRALVLLDSASTLFPDGQFGQEHAATRILALCALDRTAQARSDIKRFRRRYPSSAHITRIERACPEL